MAAGLGLKSIQIEPALHAKLKAESDRLGMKFRLYIEGLLKKGTKS